MKSLLVLVVTFMCLSFNQPPKYTWKGKDVTYKQYRDSLNLEYNKYCDSLKKNKIIVSK